jgi:hypothetical protein
MTLLQWQVRQCGADTPVREKPRPNNGARLKEKAQ